MSDNRARKTVNLETIVDLCAEIKVFFEERIGLSLPNLANDPLYGYKGEAPHPVQLWWDDLVSSKDQMLESRSMALLRENGASLIALYFQILSVKHLVGYLKIESRLKNKAEFFGAVFEVAVLSFFLPKYQNIEIRDKDCDFQIGKDGALVYIEAKSLDYDSSQRKFLANYYLIACRDLATKLKKSIAIKIAPKTNLSKISAGKVFLSISDLLNSQTSSFAHHSFSEYDILIRKIANWDEIGQGFDVNEAINIFPSEFNFCDVEAREGQTKNPIVVGIDNFKELDLKKYFISKLKSKVINQLPEAGPGIVYFWIPYAQKSNFYTIVANVVREIYCYINRNTSRINAVIIVGSSRVERPGGLDFEYQRCVIPNHNRKSAFPEWFSLLESNNPFFNTPISITVKEGLHFWFDWLAASSTGNPDMSFCSGDGAQQMHLFSFDEEHWGAMAICQDEGIYSLRVKRPTFLNGQSYRIDIVLWRGSIVMRFDEKILEGKKFA